MRRFWRQIHLWLGLSVGTVLVVIGLTGSLLVFYRTLEEQIYSDTLLVEEGGERISLEQALEKATQAYPDILAVYPPRHEHATYIATRYYKKSDDDMAYTFVSIHPHTGKILGEREWGDTVMTFIYTLHYTLILGEVGATIVGFIGVFFMISLFSGLYLWWPKAGKWKQALTFKKNARGHRRNFDIHRVFGFYPLVILLTVAFSGISMTFPETIKGGVKQFLPLDESGETRITPLPEGAKRISVEETIAIARKHFPQENIRAVDLQHDPMHAYVVSFSTPDQPMRSYGYSNVAIHPATGEVLQVQTWKDSLNGNAFMAWQYPLHNGEAFGLVGRWIIFFSGFVPLMMYVTGLLMWLKRRKAKKAKVVFSSEMKLEVGHAV